MTVTICNDDDNNNNNNTSFSDNEMKPYANEWDEKSIFPVDTFKRLADLGFAGIFVNEDMGGSGLNRVDTSGNFPPPQLSQ